MNLHTLPSRAASVRRWIAPLTLACLGSIAAYPADAEAAASTTRAAAKSTAKPKAAKEPETLEEFLGMGPDREAQQRKAEEQVAACMRKEGFTYIPNTSAMVTVRIGAAPAGEDARAWKRKHGYGLTESMGSITRAPANDPNGDIVSKLSESERRAYQLALFGEVPKDRGGTASAQGGRVVIGGSSGGEPKGCIGKAYGSTRSVFDRFAAKLEALRRRVDSDPRVVKANAAWSACMRKSGYDVKSEREVFEKVLAPAQQKLFGVPQGPGGAGGGGAVIAIGGSMTALDPAKIEQFRKIELAVARADADCSPAEDVLAKVRKEYEQAFIDENRGALDEVRGG